MRSAVVLLATLLPLSALADDKPQVTVADDGTIVGRLLVDAPEAAVRTAFPDIQAHGSFDSVLDVKITPDAEGGCQRIFRRTKGLWSPLEMYTKLCPTPRGWREYLVQSDDYDAYEIEWSVHDKDGRTEVRLTVRSEVDLPVPTSLVRQGAIAGVNQTFAELLKRLFGPKGVKVAK